MVAGFIFPKAGTNISNHFKLRKGNVDAAWGQCTAIIERSYRIPHIQHVPLEPHIAISKVDEKGEVTLWTSSQSPFAQRNLIAQSLGISQSDMRVVSPAVGGGFGGKAGVSMESLAVAIAMRSKRTPGQAAPDARGGVLYGLRPAGTRGPLQDGLRCQWQAARHGEQILLGRRRLHRVRCEHRPRGRLQLHGQVILGAYTLTVSNSPGAEMIIGLWAGTGRISGTGGIIKDGAGTLNFSGWSVANTYTGPTEVRHGLLLLGRTSVPSVPGPGDLIIGDGKDGDRTAIVRLANHEQIGKAKVTLSLDGWLDIGGFTNTIDGADLNGGEITLGTGTLILADNIKVLNSSSIINGPGGALNLSSTRTFDVGNGVIFDLQAPVTGVGGLVKRGPGYMRLGFSGTYSGLTTVAEGQLEAWAAGSLGASTSGTVVSNGASLLINPHGTIYDEALTVNGAGSAGYGALDTGDSTGTNTWTGPITLNADSVIMPYNRKNILHPKGGRSGTGPP